MEPVSVTISYSLIMFKNYMQKFQPLSERFIRVVVEALESGESDKKTGK